MGSDALHPDQDFKRVNTEDSTRSGRHEPSGELRVVETRLAENQKHAVYLATILEDEMGRRWVARHSRFRFDLEEEPHSIEPA